MDNVVLRESSYNIINVAVYTTLFRGRCDCELFCKGCYGFTATKAVLLIVCPIPPTYNMRTKQNNKRVPNITRLKNQVIFFQPYTAANEILLITEYNK